MEDKAVPAALAGIAGLQVVAAQLLVARTEGIGKKYFEKRVLAQDPDNELGLPTDADQRVRLIDEVFLAGALGATGASVACSLVAAIAALGATAAVASTANKRFEMWVTIISAGFLTFLTIVLIRQLRKGQVYEFVVGRKQKYWPKSKKVQPNTPRRWAYNSAAAVARAFMRLPKLNTMTPYTMATIVAAVISGVVTAVL